MQRRNLPQGIRIRHSRGCDREHCRCTALEAFVYDKRTDRKLRKTFTNVSEATAWRQDAQVGVRRGALRAPASVTVREKADALIAGMKAGTIRTRSGDVYKPSVVRSYNAALKYHVLDDLGARRLDDVARRDVQALVDRLLGDGLDASTIRNAIMPLRVIYRRALTRDEVTVNPMVGLEIPAVRGRRDRVAPAREAVALLAALSDEHRAVWATALYAGLRLGELRALRVGDVADGVVSVSSGWDAEVGPVAPKSAAGVRQVPIPATLATHLDAHLERAAQDAHALIFGRTAFRPFTDTHLRRQAHKAWDAAGLERIGFHECRHSYRSYLNDAGIDPTRADWYTGHAIHTVSGRYQHALPGQLTKDAETLDAYLTGAAEGKVVTLRTGAHPGARLARTAQPSGL
jgi:integrase